jgi:hypothetical protein
VRPRSRLALGGGIALLCLAVPLLPASGSAANPQSTPTTPPAQPVDTAPSSTIDVAAMDSNGVLGRARAGLAEYLAGFPDIEENLLLEECPLQAIEELLTAVAAVGRDAITADIRATIQVASVESTADGTSPQPEDVVPIGVVCDTDDANEVRPPGMTGGVYGVGVAAFDYAVAPEIDLSGVATQFPDVVPPTPDSFGFTGYRGCLGGSEAEGTTQCYSWWERDRFIVGMYVTVDRVNVDESIAEVLEVSRPLVREILDRLDAGTLRDDSAAPSTAAG